VVTWGERKREANLRRHGLDFKGCEAMFDGPVLTAEDTRVEATKHEARYYFKVLAHER